MTDITFHVNVPDKLLYACRLLRTTQKSAAKVLVCAAPRLQQQLSAQLWALDAADFLPHCTADAPAAVLAKSPIILLSDVSFATLDKLGEAMGLVRLPHDVLLNLDPAVPTDIENFKDKFGERFQRLIEIVGQQDADLQAARARWKRYKALGYTLTRHDAVTKEKQVF